VSKLNEVKLERFLKQFKTSWLNFLTRKLTKYNFKSLNKFGKKAFRYSRQTGDNKGPIFTNLTRKTILANSTHNLVSGWSEREKIIRGSQQGCHFPFEKANSA